MTYFFLFIFYYFSVGHHVFVHWIVLSGQHVIMRLVLFGILELTYLLHCVIDEHTLEYQWFMTQLFQFGHIHILGHTPIFDVVRLSIGFITFKSND